MIFNQYAQYYDIFYRRKNYRGECDFVEQLFLRYFREKPKTILDLGCGTGSHMLILAEKGYWVDGIDNSPEMLKIARAKLNSLPNPGKLEKAALESFQLKKKYDVILCLFSVIDYLTDQKALAAALERIAGHMHERSVFIFDFWQASAVEGYFSKVKRKIFRFDGQILERRSNTTLKAKENICQVHYTCRLKARGRLVKQFREKHEVRYFSVEEITGYLERAGFQVLTVCPFLNLTGRIKKNRWDITLVARRKRSNL